MWNSKLLDYIMLIWKIFRLFKKIFDRFYTELEENEISRLKYLLIILWSDIVVLFQTNFRLVDILDDLKDHSILFQQIQNDIVLLRCLQDRRRISMELLNHLVDLLDKDTEIYLKILRDKRFDLIDHFVLLTERRRSWPNSVFSTHNARFSHQQVPFSTAKCYQSTNSIFSLTKRCDSTGTIYFSINRDHRLRTLNCYGNLWI